MSVPHGLVLLARGDLLITFRFGLASGNREEFALLDVLLQARRDAELT